MDVLNRDGVYHESVIVDSIPKSGLKVKWRVPIQGGCAGRHKIYKNASVSPESYELLKELKAVI